MPSPRGRRPRPPLPPDLVDGPWRPEVARALLPRTPADARAMAKRLNAGTARPGSRARALMDYVRAGEMRSALAYTPEMGPILERWQRALDAGQVDAAVRLAGQLGELDRAGRTALAERIMSPRDARAVRTARRVREQFSNTNRAKMAAASRQRARILAEARCVGRQGLSKAAVARVVHDRLRRQAGTTGPRVPSIRTIRRVLSALKDL